MTQQRSFRLAEIFNWFPPSHAQNLGIRSVACVRPCETMPCLPCLPRLPHACEKVENMPLLNLCSKSAVVGLEAQ